MHAVRAMGWAVTANGKVWVSPSTGSATVERGNRDPPALPPHATCDLPPKPDTRSCPFYPNDPTAAPPAFRPHAKSVPAATVSCPSLGRKDFPATALKVFGLLVFSPPAIPGGAG